MVLSMSRSVKIPRFQEKKRLIIIGLDCAEPSLVFDKLKERMPNLAGLAALGTWGNLTSTMPPTTIPAWLSMFTGLDPGQLGVYGFRNRQDNSYREPRLFNAGQIDAPMIWDSLSQAGKTCYVLGVPGTYPPRPLKGRLVSSFLAPNTLADYTFPKELKTEIEAAVDGYMLDVEGYRTEDKTWLRDQIWLMTKKRFELACLWAKEPDWDLMIVAEMGIDRIQHGFWRFFDPRHRLFEPGNQFESVIPDYYEFIDGQVEKLLQAAGPEVAVGIVSDHGAQAMQGGFRINEWLIEQGDLVLTTAPEKPQPLTAGLIDWKKTSAWGEGGYCGKIYINLQGREPQGIVARQELAKYTQDLAARLEQTSDEDGQSLNTRVVFPEKEYRKLKGIPPDLIVCFGDLAWRSIAEVGTNRIHARGNDSGPDDANHAQDGIFIFSGPGLARQAAKNMSILDVHKLIADYCV
ncbi:MAG: alkaline phosphatase family protein [Deltaproteobacteria bacterium]|nr:alkaline phosphatase family protein [Deltaproteobacteria bacterium]MBW1873155.1 alkaline phosphatase family protein [Deltaproteobacteria bacterium]